MNTRERDVWMERMLAECVPGGSSCDPQRVADAIREWFATHDALLAEGSASGEGAEAVAPYAYIYEWDTGHGVHRSLRASQWNGRDPIRCIAVYTHPQPAQVEHEQRSCEGSERRPIADEVVERAALAYAAVAKDTDLTGKVRSIEPAAMRAALESAHPRGLPAGSDALRMLDNMDKADKGTRLYRYCLQWLHSYIRDAIAEQPSCGQDARDAARYRWLRESHTEKLFGELFNGGFAAECTKDCREEWLDREIDAAIAAQQRQGGAP